MSETMTVWTEQNVTDIWNQIQAGGMAPLRPLPNSLGCSIKLSNNTAYYLNVVKSGTGIAVESLPPFSYLIFPNQPDLSVQIDGSRPASSLSPDTQAVTFSTMQGATTYQHGSTTFSGTSNVTVNGTVVANISNSLLNVAVSGTVQANITNSTLNANITNASIPVSGSVSASITNASIPVTQAAGSTFNIQATNAVPITNASGGVVQVGGTIDSNITNAYINIMPSTGSIKDASGTVTTASTSQTILAAASNRQYLLIQNPSPDDMYLNIGAAATNNNSSIYLIPEGGGIVFENGFCPNGAVNLWCATAGAAYTCKYL